MKCPQQNDQWCAYFFDNRCHIDDWYEEKTGCIEPQIVPLDQDVLELLNTISPTELKAQTDVCEMIIKSAVPNDPLDRLQVAETDQIKEMCGHFLQRLVWYNDAKEKPTEGIQELFDSCEKEPEKPDTVAVEKKVSKEEDGAEWV